MCTPSTTTSDSVSCFIPCGQMTWTSQPASCSAVHSCHTRRSKGTDRFSTRISALPAKAHVPRVCQTLLGVRQPDQVDHDAVASSIECGEHRPVRAPDDAHLRVRYDVLNR